MKFSKALTPLLLTLALGSVVVPRLMAQKSPDDLRQVAAAAKQGKAVVVDVREAGEIADGMVKGALWMPTSKISPTSPEWQAFLKQLPQGDARKTTKVAVYCRSGGRAGRVVEQLKGMGYVAENIGGFSDWKEAGLETERGQK